MTAALLGALDQSPDTFGGDEARARTRLRAAWLLKHTAAPSAWKQLGARALDRAEAQTVRRYLIEALDHRVAFAGSVGWSELGPILRTLGGDDDARVRDGVVGVLMSLPHTIEEARAMLLEFLRDADETVVASAANALRFSLRETDLDPPLANRLLTHTNSLIRQSIKEALGRAERTEGPSSRIP